MYSNSLDHALDLDAFFAEHARVLKPGWFALYDVHQDYTPGEPAPFEASLWLRREDVLVRALHHFARLRRLQAEPDWTWMHPPGTAAQQLARRQKGVASFVIDRAAAVLLELPRPARLPRFRRRARATPPRRSRR